MDNIYYLKYLKYKKKYIDIEKNLLSKELSFKNPKNVYKTPQKKRSCKFKLELSHKIGPRSVSLERNNLSLILFRIYNIIKQQFNQVLAPNGSTQHYINFHIQLVNNPSEPNKQQIYNMINNNFIDVSHKYSWAFFGRAFGLGIPGNKHITIAFFPKNPPSIHILHQIIESVLQTRLN